MIEWENEKPVVRMGDVVIVTDWAGKTVPAMVIQVVSPTNLDVQIFGTVGGALLYNVPYSREKVATSWRYREDEGVES